MKGFAYTARDAAGDTKSGYLNAADRAAAIRELRERGLVPLTIEERDAPVVAEGRLPRILTIAGVVFAVVVVALFVLFARRPGKPTRPATPTPPAAPAAGATTAPAPKGTPSVPPAAGDKVADKARDKVEDTPEPLNPEPSPATTGQGITVKMHTTTQRPQRPATPRVLIVNPPPKETNAPPAKPMFDKTTEQHLAIYAEPGVDMPPPPPGMLETSEAEIAKALESDIVITEDDDEATVRTKESVALMKEELRKYLAAGGTAKDFFDALATRQVEEAEMVSVGRAYVIEKLKSGDNEGALAAYKEVSGHLEKQGLHALRLPVKYRKQLEAIAAAAEP